MEIKGKNAVVTGGDRGIGKAISLALAQKGANVAIIFHKNTAMASEVVSEVERYNTKSIKIQADVRDFNSIHSALDKVVEKFGSIDILVNNAGIVGKNKKLEKISLDEWRDMLDVNLTGVFNSCKAAVNQLVKNRGKIVNISSIAGKNGGELGCHYAATKAGVIGLTFFLAKELAPYVTVNAVAPGPVDTDFLSPEEKARLSSMTPFGRIAKPEEIAHTVVYLLENDYVSGEVADVNAARYMD
jgi:3-oxoacyl-[acyl-carrier protein] reductase